MTSFKHRAVVCAIARDEDRYLVEWIAYHLAIGFDHVFLYDNLSVRPPAGRIAPKALREKVTIIRWPSIPGDLPQTSAYRHFLHTYRDWVEWAAIIDLDEFINLKQDASISGFLERFPTASAVSINWRVFGSSGEVSYRKLPVTERFCRASQIEFGPNLLVKTIHRLSRTKEILIHHGDYLDNDSVRSASGKPIANSPHLAQEEDNYSVAQINHYFLKSIDEWALKNARGYWGYIERSPETYAEYDRNEVEDRSILTRRLALHKMMGRVRRRRGLLSRFFSLT